MKKNSKKYISYLVVLIVLIISIVSVARWRVVSRSDGHIIRTNEIEKIDPCQNVVILGARVNADGTMSPILKERAMAALDLYQNKKVCHIIISGHKEKYYDEVSPIKEYLVENGIPSEIILTDENGKDTFTSIKNARDLFGFDDILIVTQAFHLPRAVYIGGALGMDAKGFTAYKFPFVDQGEKIKYLLREWPAAVKAVWQSEIRY